MLYTRPICIYLTDHNLSQHLKCSIISVHMHSYQKHTLSHLKQLEQIVLDRLGGCQAARGAAFIQKFEAFWII